jgi:hypothetical protein
MKAKYAIFAADDNGTAIGCAIAVGEAEQTEDWFGNRRAAIVDGLTKLQNCAPENITDLGWHTARRLDGYLADRKNLLKDLILEINMLEQV